MLKTQLNNFFDFLNLLIQTTDHVVCAVGDLLDHHQRDQRVNRGREHLFELVGIGQKGYPFAYGELPNVNTVRNVDNCSRENGPSQSNNPRPVATEPNKR